MMLSPENFPVPLTCLTETDSTNNYLQTLRIGQSIEEWTTVVAGFQTSGRGQRGNSWESDPDKNLLFSFILFPRFLEPHRQFLISQVVSLAIKEELDAYISDISIKWPNDIYWKDKKIAGILIENDLTGRTISQSIAGVGININQEVFRSTAPNPVSLFQITGKRYDIIEILRNIMMRAQAYYSLLEKNDVEPITRSYKQGLFRRNGLHPYKDAEGEFRARIIDVEPDGKLILEDETYTRRGYVFKEVEYLLR